MTTAEGSVLGLDVGISTVGWALLKGCSIVGAGVWTFDAPETAKNSEPKAAIRRRHRGQRRVISRRRQRMNNVRFLFSRCGLLPTSGQDALAIPGLNPWQLRTEGLTRVLLPTELAVALGHIARHRGFRSNAKRALDANAAESSKMKSAMAQTQERLAQYRTVGEMLWSDHGFRDDRERCPSVFRARNRDGDYTRTALRSDLEYEVRTLLAAQRRLGNDKATNEIEKEFIEVAFAQQPLRDSTDKVGYCPFEPDEKRTARRSYSFERFRLLARLNTIRLRDKRHERSITVEEIARVLAVFGTQKTLSFKTLRRLLALASDEHFVGVPLERETQDVVARSGGAADGTAALRSALTDAGWALLINAPELLDQIAEIITFRNDESTIRSGFDELAIDTSVSDALMVALAEGKFKHFKGAGHISAKAARTILPYLAEGLMYSEACAEAGYDHARGRVQVVLDVEGQRGVGAIRTLLTQENQNRRFQALLPNPVARKAVFETLKQVKAIIHEFGLPERIHVELAREVGKSAEERSEISKGIEKRSREKDRLRIEFSELLRCEPTGEDLLRYELWKEQNGRCIYSDSVISPVSIISSDNTVQVDHILPWSRFADDSFVNKSLCSASANQEKKGRTPYEWFREERSDLEWETFVARVESLKGMKGRKKRNYLLKDSAEREEAFKDRNLNDTRYAARVVMQVLRLLYSEEMEGSTPGGERRVLARPGPLTARLRQGWGLERLKKINGERIPDDRHHAVDAIAVAATTNGMLQQLTLACQRAEREGRPQVFKKLALPWPCFLDDVGRAYDDVFVARAERCRARGKAHEETIRQISERDGKALVFERKALNDKFTHNDLQRIKDPERNGAYVEAIRAWIEAGRPRNTLPISPRGDPIRKVRLRTDKKVDVEIRGGAADRGEMARVDVFREILSGKYFVVPVYPHEIARLAAPPALAVPSKRPIDGEFEFLWSLYQLSVVEIEKRSGQVISGYFRSFDRSTGAINISEFLNLEKVHRSIGVQTLRRLKKFRVDRLGRRFEVEREVRTWRGKACT